MAATVKAEASVRTRARRWRRHSVWLALAVASLLAAGCGGGGGEEASQPTVKTMTEIRDRAVAEGFEVLDCQELGHVKCVGDVSVDSSGDEVDSAWLFLLQNGLWSPGPDTISVEAHPDPKDLRASEEAHRDNAAEKERLANGQQVYIIVGDRLWSTYAPGAKVSKAKFLDIVGKLEGCAPNCQFKEPSTAKPATSPNTPDLGPATAKQAATALAPIVRRGKAAGYLVTPPMGEVVVMTEGDTEAIGSAYAAPAGARDSGRFDAQAIARGDKTVEDFAVIDNRIWETYTTGATEQFRAMVETVEGCAPRCQFSMSSFSP